MPTADPDAVVAGVHTQAIDVEVLGDELTSGTLDQLALRLDHLRRTAAIVKDAIAQVETTMALDMESDAVVTAHYEVIREPAVRSSWLPSGAERMREDIRREVVARFAIDYATGEIDQGRAAIVTQAINELFEGIPSFDSIKVAARKRWGLTMSDYREYTEGHTIKLLPARP